MHRSVPPLIVALFVASAFQTSVTAQIIPNQYVVELETAPVGRLARALRQSAEAKAARATILASQQKATALIAVQKGKVIGSLSNAVNALIVEIPDENAQSLKAIPSVKRVFPVSIAHVHLDHALPLHQVPQAWARIGGMNNAGLGMKIGVLDTGISPNHPAFQDSSLTPPAGYPIISGPQNASVVNNKIIVARDYSNLYGIKNDSAVDRAGHGTNTADCATGETAIGPMATVTGIAPKAFLGVYKIAPLNTGSASSAVIAQALDDAFGDGMDVVNLSFGSSLSLYGSLIDYVLDEVTRLGMIVVTSAGNSGNFPDTVGDVADDGNAISVGASQNDRYFGGTISVAGGAGIAGTTGAYPAPNAAVSGALNNVNAWDPSFGCSALAPGSLAGQIALVTPTGCLYETALNHFKDAGAFAAILYSATPNAAPVPNWTPLTSTLPALYVSNKDGLALRAMATTLPSISMVFQGIPHTDDNRVIASFSSRGPTEFSGLKPDMLATGTNVYMATQSLDSTGGIFNSSGFISESGTSYSSPLVAGAAAVLKGARPGLTTDQYKSLLVNSASPMITAAGNVETLQHMGAGVLNLDSALSSNIAVSPTSLSFGIGGPTLANFDLLAVTNVGSTADTFTISTIPFDGTPAPTFAADGSNVYSTAPGSNSIQVTLAAHQSQVVDMLWKATNLPLGTEQQGMVAIHGSTSGSQALVPYWHGVPDFVPFYVSTLGAPASATAGTKIGYYFKVTDHIGTGIVTPSIIKASGTVTAGSGSVSAPVQSTSYPNYFYFTLTLDANPGVNTFQFKIAFATINVTIQGTKPPAAQTAVSSLFGTPEFGTPITYRLEADGVKTTSTVVRRDRP